MHERQHGHGVVERETVVACALEEAWRLWTDPERLVRWMGSAAEIELRPGGAFRVSYANGAVMAGTVVRAQAPSRLEVTWGWEDPDEAVRPGGSTVEVSFEAVEGGTRVVVRHHGLADAERVSHAEGWDYFIPRLVEAAAS